MIRLEGLWPWGTCTSAGMIHPERHRFLMNESLRLQFILNLITLHAEKTEHAGNLHPPLDTFFGPSAWTLQWLTLMFGSSNRTIIQTQTSKTTQKMGYWAQNQASAMAISVPWPAPYRKWVGWTEEQKHRHGAVNLKDLERFWMKEWSLISCQVLSNLIRHYRRKFRAVKLANGGFKEYWIKGAVNCGQCVLEKNIYFIMIFLPF